MRRKSTNRPVAISLVSSIPTFFLKRMYRDSSSTGSSETVIDNSAWPVPSMPPSTRAAGFESTRRRDPRRKMIGLDTSTSRAVHAEAVFLAFRDDAPTADAICDALVAATTDRPLMHFIADEVTHTLWRVPDPEVFKSLFETVPDLYIADGHHRSAAGGENRRGTSGSQSDALRR